MNYYGPRQREADGRWDYTCMNDKVVWAVGYCHRYKEFTFDGAVFDKTICLTEEHAMELNSKYGRFKDKYHTDGHRTGEEASKCYKTYLLDNFLVINKISFEEAKEKKMDLKFCRVQECGELTASSAKVQGGLMYSWYLCEKHLNRETVEELFTVDTFISSY